MRTFYFRVADHIFAIETAHDLLACCPNYAPFLSSQQSDSCLQPVLTLRVSESELPSIEGWTLLYTDRSDDDMPRIEMYRRGEEWQFRFSQSRDGAVVGAFTCDARMQNAVLYGEPTRFAIDNTMMLLYAFSTAGSRTLLFHASVIVRGENGYMFLGHSGTGKSTVTSAAKTAKPPCGYRAGRASSASTAPGATTSSPRRPDPQILVA